MKNNFLTIILLPIFLNIAVLEAAPKKLNNSDEKKICKRGFFNPFKCKVISDKNNDVSIKSFLNEDVSNKDITVYTGQFDITDEVGDDETSLVGIEHKNPTLFKNTFLGKFSPVTGAFVTGKGAAYFYTGVQGQYNIGPLKVLPSFAPGYYQKGDGKEMGDVLEFKSEIRFGIDIFDNSHLGYSYSHISNNDWGSVNPGADNQSVTFSKKF